MINIVIPMAGAGSRFVRAGYDLPKPFIDVAGATMIERVLDNLSIPGAVFTLIARREHQEKYPECFARLQERYGCRIVTIDGLTAGACCTVLLAATLINNDTPLLLANSDQLVDCRVEDFIADAQLRGLDGSILTFSADEAKWSYARVAKDGLVTEVREKEPISTHATVGLYYFGRGKDFVRAAHQMIAANDRIKGEFYTAPTYNYLIRDGGRIGIYDIAPSRMHGLGTPDDLETYLHQIEATVA